MTPYTYLIGWKDQEKYYYGVRFAKGHEGKNSKWRIKKYLS